MSALIEGYRGIVCDLDGVVYRGHEPVEHAVDALNAAKAAGIGVVYATNNASRPPEQVHEHLSGLGVRLHVADVVTSAMAGAAHLADVLPEGAAVLAVGGEGVRVALSSAGLRPVTTAEVDAGIPVRAVLQGFGRHVAWTDLAAAAWAVNGGARWVATNPDLTVPTDRGIAPGNGSLVQAVRQAADVDPEVVGKPYPPLYLRCAEHLGVEPGQTLAVGDRLDTDIEGATRTGMDSLFVFTGVNTPLDIVLADPSRRPTHLGADLRVLHEEYVTPRVSSTGSETVAECGAARAVVAASGIDLADAGTPSERLRAIVAAAVHHGEAGSDLPTWPDVDAWIREGES